MCVMGHKWGQRGQMQDDVGLCRMSCDAHTHGVANDTMESGVMRMSEEPGRKTSILEHRVDRISDFFFFDG